MTSKPIRLLFDECLGWPLIEQVASLAGFGPDEFELGHAVKLGFGGMKDEDWVPQIAEAGWKIITADRGKRPRPGSGEKLSRVCRKWGVTYAAFSRSLVKAPSFQKVRILLAIWDSLPELQGAPRGSEFSIRPAGENHWKLVLIKEGPSSFVSPNESPATQQKLILPE